MATIPIIGTTRLLIYYWCELIVISSLENALIFLTKCSTEFFMAHRFHSWCVSGCGGHVCALRTCGRVLVQASASNRISTDSMQLETGKINYGISINKILL
jgi:hypothetical protein